MVYDYGDFGSQFYIILKGRASILVPMKKSQNSLTNKKMRIMDDKVVKHDDSTQSLDSSQISKSESDETSEFSSSYNSSEEDDEKSVILTTTNS